MKKAFKNAVVLTCDSNFTVYENGMVLIDGGEISYVGYYDDAKFDDFDAKEMIDAGGNILMPGLINAHTHLPMTLFSGFGSGLPLKEWLEEKIWPAEAKLTPEDVYIGSKMGIAQMLLSGTTAFLDMYYFIDDMARAIEETGIRAVLSRAVLDPGGFDERLAESIESAKKYKDHPMIDIMMGPHAVYTNGKQSLLRVLDEAKSLGCAIHVHVSETAGEVEACIQEHGMSPVAYLESLGYFETHVAAAHCVHVSDEDIAILASRGVNVVHNPTSNMKLASGIAPVQKMIDAGINVALGTDGASSNNNLDMLEEMHIAALLAKLKDGSPTAVDAQCAIEMATINGAKALGIDDKCGSLEAGKRADIIMLDMKSAFSYPQREYLNSLVYSMGRRQVAMTMIEGRVLQENGKVLGLDIESLGRTFNNCVDRLC